MVGMRSVLKWVLLLAIFGALLMPPVKLSETWPVIEWSDALFPVVLAVLIVDRKALAPSPEFLRTSRLFLILLVAFVGSICLSIAINNRVDVLRDWFEPMKFLKFMVYLWAFASVFKPIELRFVLSLLFIPLAVFNLLHYFNVAGFNELVEPLYAPAHHLEVFGLNSLGQPDTKRALGTMGNPNINGLMFAALLVVFVVPVNYRRGYLIERTLVLSAIMGIMLCQSRTTLIAFAAVMLLYLLMVKARQRAFLYYAAFALVAFALLDLVGNSYLGSLGSAERLQRAGEGRLSQWLKIFDTMPGHWIFGHAPSKEFFEANGIYAESEFVLILYRYGILGLVLWCAAWCSWAIQWFKAKGAKGFAFLALPTIYLVGAMTNNPMHANKLAMLLAFAGAYLYSLTDDCFGHA